MQLVRDLSSPLFYVFSKAQITPLLLACKKSSLEIVRQLELKYANLLIEDVVSTDES